MCFSRGKLLTRLKEDELRSRQLFIKYLGKEELSVNKVYTELRLVFAVSHIKNERVGGVFSSIHF